MHNQVLVISPQDVELEDVMYPYQEIDKWPHEKLNDDRCQWILIVPENEIPELLNKIEEDIKKDINQYLEVLKYRSTHSYEDWKEKYGRYTRDPLNSYVYYRNKLKEFNEIKDLPMDNPEQITFIKEYGGYVIDEYGSPEIYIKGVGYGFFHNPYQIWDYYALVNERRFPRDVNFLITKEGYAFNQLSLDELDISKTVKNIKEYTRVWEYIIFCEKDPKDSRLYTIDDIRFSDEWNKHCLVEDLEEVLKNLAYKYKNRNYIVTALDYHW